jgi:hypothetical protein
MKGRQAWKKSGAASGCCSGSHFSIIKRGWRKRTILQLARYHRVLRLDKCVGLCIKRLVKKINTAIASGYVRAWEAAEMGPFMGASYSAQVRVKWLVFRLYPEVITLSEALIRRLSPVLR